MKSLSRTTQLWLAAHGLLLERGVDLFRHLNRATRSFEPEAIHDLRVSSRRLREGLALFAPCYPQKHFAPIKGALKNLTTMMGAIRNTDEALLFFSRLSSEIAVSGNESVSGLLAVLQARRGEEKAALKRGLRKLDSATLSKQFKAKCNIQLIFTEMPVDLLQPVVEFFLAGIGEREYPLGVIIDQAIIETNITEQHRLRIALKHFRYRFEFLVPLAAEGYAELYAAIKGFQEILGKMHDLDTFAVLVDEIIADRLVADSIKERIAQHRHLLFAEFIDMHHALPLNTLGDRVRSLL